MPFNYDSDTCWAACCVFIVCAALLSLLLSVVLKIDYTISSSIGMVVALLIIVAYFSYRKINTKTTPQPPSISTVNSYHCVTCGTIIPSNSNLCNSCGAPQNTEKKSQLYLYSTSYPRDTIKDDSTAIASLEMGNDYFKKGDYEKAIECYDLALKLNPNNLEAKRNKEIALKKSWGLS